MCSRFINRQLRRLPFGILTALLILAASVFSTDGVHADHHHIEGLEHRFPGGLSDHCHLHEDGSHHNHHHNDGKRAEECAVCFFKSTSLAIDFPSVSLMPSTFVRLVDAFIPQNRGYATIIVTLWSGRAPPSLSAS